MMPGVQPPPEILDRARVLQFASLARSQPTGKTRHVVGGAEITGFAAVAIARYDDEPNGVYLFYCDRDWNVITDTRHEDIAAALAQADFEFGLLQFNEVSTSAAPAFRNDARRHGDFGALLLLRKQSGLRSRDPF